MMYINRDPLYLTAEEYKEAGFTAIPDDQIEPELRKSQNKIDNLTFNRIKKRGFENLTDFQKGIIQEVVAELSNFSYENSDILESVVSQYSINGVSLSLDNSQNLSNVRGILIRNDIYEHLKKTGLCVMKI